MEAKHEQFLRQAQTCMAEADRANPEIRQAWFELAARWLEMIPAEDAPALRPLEAIVRDTRVHPAAGGPRN